MTKDTDVLLWVAHKTRYQKWVECLREFDDKSVPAQRILESIELQLYDCRESERLQYFQNILILLTFVLEPQSPLLEKVTTINEVINILYKII